MAYGCLLSSEFRYYSLALIHPETFHFLIHDPVPNMPLLLVENLMETRPSTGMYIFLPASSETPGCPFENRSSFRVHNT